MMPPFQEFIKTSIDSSTSILVPPDSNLLTRTTTNAATHLPFISQEGSNEKLNESSNQITTITSSTTIAANNDKRACHVVITNAPDFHYEVIESTALRYPLPFHKFNCTTSKPIIFDFVLYNNWFGKVDITAGKVKPKYLNDSEFWSWNTYFESYLQYKILDRVDGTKAFFNQVLKFSDMDDKTDEVDAKIDASCDINQMFIRKMIKDDRLFCVLHGICDRCKELHYERSCFISPMWPKEQCTFMTLDLPKFDKSEFFVSTSGHEPISGGIEGNPMHQPNDTITTTSSSSNTMRICVFGGNRNHTMLSNLFTKVPYQKYNATFHVGGRDIRQLSKVYERSGIDMSKVHIFYEKRYREYYRNVAQCHIYLPATDPNEKPSHFPTGMKKLTGSIPQVIAYKLPSVMHMELEKLYHEYLLHCPVEVYDDTFESKVKALTRMMERVSQYSSGFLATTTK